MSDEPTMRLSEECKRCAALEGALRAALRCLDSKEQRINAKDAEIERLMEALEHIQSWFRAFPVAFPESGLRNVVEGMKEYITKALEGRR